MKISGSIYLDTLVQFLLGFGNDLSGWNFSVPRQTIGRWFACFWLRFAWFRV